MNSDDYVKQAMRTNNNKSNERLNDKINYGYFKYENVHINISQVIHACLGLSGECGEVNDIIKKYIFHNKDLDVIHLKKEIGDVLWYIALFCDACHFSLEDIMQLNIDKLKERYPDGFSEENANNRKEGDI